MLMKYTEEGTKIKVILLNGFKYQGTRIGNESGYVELIDDKDNKRRKFPVTAISMIEEG